MRERLRTENIHLRQARQDLELRKARRGRAKGSSDEAQTAEDAGAGEGCTCGARPARELDQGGEVSRRVAGRFPSLPTKRGVAEGRERT